MNYTKQLWKAIKRAGYYMVDCGDYRVASNIIKPEDARLIAAAPELYEALKEADDAICQLCKIVNPQHATMDYGKGCKMCVDRGVRLKALAKVEGNEVKEYAPSDKE